MTLFSPLVLEPVRGSCQVRLVSALVAFSALAWANAAIAATGGGDSIRVVASLAPDEGIITGTAYLPLARVCRDGKLLLHQHPNLYREPEPDLSDVTHPQRFPAGFSPGSMELGDPVLDGTPVPFPGPCPPGTGAKNSPRLEIPFVTRLPVRFGPFGAIDGFMVAFGGWFPAPAGGPHAGGTVGYEIELTVPRSGFLVVDSQLRRVGAGHTEQFGFGSVMSPLLYFRPHGVLVAGTTHSGRRILLLTDDGSAGTQRTDRVLEAARLALDGALAASGPEGPNGTGEKSGSSFPSENGIPSTPMTDGIGTSERRQPPFLVLEAPLRESLALPFPGGVLCADLAFGLTPFGPLLQQHRDNLHSAAAASLLLERGAAGVFDALLALNLLQFLSWERGASDPIFLRRFFRNLEFWGSLDKMGSDPQANFQTSMFFTPELAIDIARLPDLQGVAVPSPRTAARLVVLTLGADRTAAALDDALGSGRSLAGALVSRASTEAERSSLAAAFAPMDVDLELNGVRKENGVWVASVCKRGATAEFPVELRARRGRTKLHTQALCPDECCDAPLPGFKRRPAVVLDPHGVFLQTQATLDDPRLNDRNFADLKWIVNRPYLSFSGGDLFPSAGAELNVQPRWDLHNTFFLTPTLTDSRIAAAAGWRYSFGPKVRPNFLSESISLGLRVAVALDGEGGSSFGPALTYVHLTRQSRMNPFRGNWSYAYLYPVASWGFDRFGARGGVMVSQMFGKSPDHIFAVRLNLDSGAGWLPPWEIPATGGAEGLRALATYALAGVHRAGTNLEYRLMLFRGPTRNLGDVVWFNGLQVAFFVDAATVGRELSHVGRTQNIWTDVGLGLRPHFDLFGVMPSIFAVDIAYLLPVLGAAGGGFNGVLSFYQPF